jgi:transcriptional regulator with XRE-family HTH domain
VGILGQANQFYLQFLKAELDRRISKNEQYSLRSFAAALNIDPSFLSKVLSKKKLLSLEGADSIINILEPNNIDLRVKFLKSISEEGACRSLDNYDPSLSDCDKN